MHFREREMHLLYFIKNTAFGLLRYPHTHQLGFSDLGIKPCEPLNASSSPAQPAWNFPCTYFRWAFFTSTLVALPVAHHRSAKVMLSGVVYIII